MQTNDFHKQYHALVSFKLHLQDAAHMHRAGAPSVRVKGYFHRRVSGFSHSTLGNPQGHQLNEEVEGWGLAETALSWTQGMSQVRWAASEVCQTKPAVPFRSRHVRLSREHEGRQFLIASTIMISPVLSPHPQDTRIYASVSQSVDWISDILYNR